MGYSLSAFIVTARSEPACGAARRGTSRWRSGTSVASGLDIGRELVFLVMAVLDVIDAAVIHPNGHVYFFGGDRYVKYKPGGEGALSAGEDSMLRTIGVSGWRSFPEPFRRDLDAALYYPNDSLFGGRADLYFFKGDSYIKFTPGRGVVPTSAGEVVRQIGVTGWTSFPPEFRANLDAALYYRANGHAYFFKGEQYIKYKPGSGVVPRKNGGLTRIIGAEGWDFPNIASFHRDLDAAFDYPQTGRTYFFKGRDYVRWQPGVGPEARYPRRIGLHHRGHGGWPGLSHLIAVPCTVDVSEQSARVWFWLTGGAAPEHLRLELDGVLIDRPDWRSVEMGPDQPATERAMRQVARDSRICQLHLHDLEANRRYELAIKRRDSDIVIERIEFTTAPPVTQNTGTIRFALCSCANTTAQLDARGFEHMRAYEPAFAVFAGDNCYYYDKLVTSTQRSMYGDWSSRAKMLTRQLEARNHPQFVPFCKHVPIFSTWDDHDCGFDNVTRDAPISSTTRGDWVGMDAAVGVYRAMWPHRYSKNTDLYYSFRWGPLEFFVTDSRFHKQLSREPSILGESQLTELIVDLRRSSAQVKVLVIANVLLHGDHGEGLWPETGTEPVSETATLLETLRSADLGARVLVLSGDVHISECVHDGTNPRAVSLMEVTSSPLCIKADQEPAIHPTLKGDATRCWSTNEESFAIIDVDIRAVVSGEITDGTIEVRAISAQTGETLFSRNPGVTLCHTRWNLATGEVVTGPPPDRR